MSGPDITKEQYDIFKSWFEKNGKKVTYQLSLINKKLSDLSVLQQIQLCCKLDPVLFAELICGMTDKKELHPWQKDFLRHVQRTSKVSVRSGTGVGKTRAAAILVFWFLMCHHPCKVTCLSSSEEQLKTGLWNELGIVFSAMPDWISKEYEFQQTRIYLKAKENDCFVAFRSPNEEKPEALQGIHSENNLVIIDEAAGIGNVIFDAFAGIFSDANPKLVLLGNPNRNTGYFYNTHKSPNVSAEWQTMHIPALQEVCKSQARDTLVKHNETTYGKESNEYRIRVLGEFPLVDGNSIINRADMEPCLDLTAQEEGGIIIWGIDLAESEGRDRTCIAKRQGNTLLEPITWWRTSDRNVTLANILREYTLATDKPSIIYVDAGGFGAGYVADLKAMPIGAEIIGTRGSDEASSTQYANIKSESWFRAREWFKTKNRVFRDVKKERAKYEDLINELCTPGYIIDAKGKFLVEKKTAIRSRTGVSPDLADSFVLTFTGNDKYTFDDGPIEMDTSWIV